MNECQSRDENYLKRSFIFLELKNIFQFQLSEFHFIKISSVEHTRDKQRERERGKKCDKRFLIAS